MGVVWGAPKLIVRSLQLSNTRKKVKSENSHQPLSSTDGIEKSL